MRNVKCSTWALPLSKCSVARLTEIFTSCRFISFSLGFLHRMEAALRKEGGLLQASLYLPLLLCFSCRSHSWGKARTTLGHGKAQQAGSAEANIPHDASVQARKPSLKCRLWLSPKHDFLSAEDACPPS